MIQLIKDFRWFLIVPVIVLALVSSLVVGMTIGGKSSPDRLSVANLQLQQTKDNLSRIQNSLSAAESRLANVKDNGEESFYRGIWLLCMALEKGEQPEICFNVAASFLVNNYYNIELPSWNWGYVQDTANSQP